MLGVDFKVKVMDAAGPDGRSKRVKVTIWDTGKDVNFLLIIFLFILTITIYTIL